MHKVTQPRQRGLTLIGFLFVLVVVLIGALLSFRVIPAYIEYLSVKKALEGALAESKDLTQADVRRLLDRRLGAEYIDSVHANDVEVTREGGQTTASVSWQTKLPLVANATLLLDFDASASR